MSPAEVELTHDEFLRIARAMFDADDATLERLYPMVTDLRGLAAHVSRIALSGDETPLSENGARHMSDGQSLHYLPIMELAARLRSGELTAVDLVEHFCDRIEELDSSLHTVITLAKEPAIEAAREADERLRTQSAGPLTGIPVTVKDAIRTKGIRTTYNSRLKGDLVPDDEPVAIQKLRSAGAIILAKANANEFFGIPPTQTGFPRPRNPFNTNFVSLGSSSGSGASIAAGFATASIGSDSAGSVRLPAGQHGLVGMKATNGRISRTGTGGFSAFQIYGPLARTTADGALLTQVMSGYDPADPDSSPLPVPDYVASAAGDADVRGWKVGVPWRYIRSAPVEPDIMQAFEQAVESLAQLGVDIVDIALTGMAEARMATFVAMYTEHHAEQAESLQTGLDLYGESARLYAMQGAFISALDYLNARKVGYRVQASVNGVLEHVKAIAMPTSPFVTAEAGRNPAEHRAGINTCFTCPFNLTRHPAISVPAGIAANGMPIGMQFTGRLFDEASLFTLSQAFEQATDWSHYHPEL